MAQKGSIKTFAETHRDFLLTNYTAGRGTQWLAEQLGTFRNTITRALKSLGVTMRSKSESQLLNLELNGHPMAGVPISEELKVKISEGISAVNKNMTTAQKKVRSDNSKKNWEKRTDEEKRAFRQKGFLAIRETAEKGSKLENYIYEGLIAAGYNCEQHKMVLANHNLEVDILLTDKMIAIEVDGPSHISPVWGQDALIRTTKSDSEKNGLLVLNNYKIIRIQNSTDSTSNKVLRDSLSKTIKIIEDINNGSEFRNIIVEQI